MSKASSKLVAEVSSRAKPKKVPARRIQKAHNLPCNGVKSVGSPCAFMNKPKMDMDNNEPVYTVVISSGL